MSKEDLSFQPGIKQELKVRIPFSCPELQCVKEPNPAQCSVLPLRSGTSHTHKAQCRFGPCKTQREHINPPQRCLANNFKA